MVEVPERVTTDFSDRLYIIITVRQTASRPWYSGLYQLSSTHPSGKESCHSGQFYPAIQYDGKTIYKARNILFTAKCLSIVSTESIAVSRLSEVKFTGMLFHRLFYCYIGCLVNLSILILTFHQTVVLLFFIDLLIVSHSILIGRSFSADDGLIQYQWAAHSVPFVRAGLMRWALVHCMTDISAGRLIGPWTLLPCGESIGSGQWSWLRSPCDTHRQIRTTCTKIAIPPNICINIVNNREGGNIC